MFDTMEGVPWEPVPGKEGIRIMPKAYKPEDKEARLEIPEGEVKELGDAAPGLGPQHVEGDGDGVEDLPVWLLVLREGETGAVGETADLHDGG